VVNQSLMAFPMLALYLFSIGIAWLFGRRKSPRSDGWRRMAAFDHPRV